MVEWEVWILLGNVGNLLTFTQLTYLKVVIVFCQVQSLISGRKLVSNV